MAGNQVVVSITGNAKGLSKALGDSTSGLSKFGKVAGVVALAAGAAVVGIGVKAVKSASELQQNLGAMESVFKSSSGQMEAWANKAASSVGLAKSEYAGLATVLGSQLKNMGVAQDQLAGQTDGLIRMGSDLAAQFGGSTSDAVSALSSLLRGERDPIERYGVSINDAAIKAKLAEMGLSGLSGEAEKNAKLQATLALLSQQTADAMGAFSRESTTLAGAQQRLSAGTENLYATLGTALLPAVTAVTAAIGAMVNGISESAWFGAFTANLTSASNAFADFVFGILNGESSLSGIDIAAFITNAIPRMFAARDSMIATFAEMLPGIISGITSALPGIIQVLATSLTTSLQVLVPLIAGMAPTLLAAGINLFMSLVTSILTVLPQLITTVLGLVPTLVAAIVSMIPLLLAGAVQLFTALVQAIPVILPLLLTSIVTMLPGIITSLLSMIPMILDSAIQMFTALVEALPVVIPQLITAVIALLPKLVTTILNMIPKILESAIKLFTALVESLPVILPLLINAILDLLPMIVSTVVGMIPRLLNAAVQLFTGIVTAIPKVVPKLVSTLIGLAPKMVSTLIGLVPQLVNAGVNLISGLVSGLWSAASSVGSALLSIAQDAIGNFLAFLGIKSPSRLMMKYGKNTVQGLVKGLTGNGSLVDKAMSGLSSRVAGGFSADLSSGDLNLSGGRSGASGDVYNITVNGGLDSSAAIGRSVVDSIEAYRRAGGRRTVSV